MTAPVPLGEINTPSGVLVVIDPGLGRFWRHAGDAGSPRRADGEEIDMRITGPDALTAGRAYDRQFDPRYLFDIPVDQAERVQAQFDAFAVEHGFDARAERLSDRVPHTERARLAVAVGGGIGVVTFNRLWAVACDGLPVDRMMPVVATPMPEGEFAGRWRWIDVIVVPEGEVVTTEPVQGVMVEHGQLMCIDLDALGEFRMWQSVDGLGDLVFWGADADELADSVGARRLNDNAFGWTDVPMAEVGVRADRTQRLVDERGLRVAIDYRPHDNLERLNAQVRVSETRAGVLSLLGAQACGFDNRWGDGVFTAERHLGGGGQLLRVRLNVGGADSQLRLRRAWLMTCGAIVSRLVWDEGEPPRFIERVPTSRADDSGWQMLSGAESDQFMEDPANFRILRVGQLVERYPVFGVVVDAPIGSSFRLQGDGYLAD